MVSIYDALLVLNSELRALLADSSLSVNSRIRVCEIRYQVLMLASAVRPDE